MRCGRSGNAGRAAGMGRAALALAALLAAVWLAAVPADARAAEQYPSSPNHRGVAPFDPYLVFPENRPGNGVYLDNRLVFSDPGLTIVDVLPLPVQGRFVYYALEAGGQERLGVSVKPNDAQPRITAVAPGFYHAVMVLDGVVYKKMYRIIEQNILDLLPNSKTADGAVAGPTGVAFYHVATVIREEQEDGGGGQSFGLRLHLALYDDERPRHLNYLVTNALPRVKIGWLDDTRLEIGLADGRTEVLSVAQFQ